MFWQPGMSAPLVIRAPPRGSQAIGANAAASPGPMSTSMHEPDTQRGPDAITYT